MKDEIESTLNSLKDFQKETVDYVFDQLYRNGRCKMLIADEVGLGKTIVAKGIIARAFDHSRAKDEQAEFRVVYICSNQAIARQNLRKLNLTKNEKAIETSRESDRITDLAYESEDSGVPAPFKIKAFTPATSFNDKTNAGKYHERVLLFRLLYLYADFEPFQNSLKWILKATQRMGDGTWEDEIRKAIEFDKGYRNTVRPIRSGVRSHFRRLLEEEVADQSLLRRSYEVAGFKSPIKYWTLLKKLCSLEVRKNNYYKYAFCQEIVSALRFLLSRACLQYLKADIYILDEFQRYKQLIQDAVDDDERISPAIQLARAILSDETAKILMLSATPFKPYTNDFNELNGEIHHKEFETVLKFLNPEKNDAFWKNYEEQRNNYFAFLRHPDRDSHGFEKVQSAKNYLEETYRKCMVRTERIIASKESDALIHSVLKEKPIEVQPEDIDDFVKLDLITSYLNKIHGTKLAIPLEYVKSSPFALSFLDNYHHKKKIEEFANKDPGLMELLAKTGHAWVDFDTIDNYKPLIPPGSKTVPNAKLRLLLEETIEKGGWRLLWIPPTMNYYEFAGAFSGMENYSKTLIFSSWLLVPRMIASLVSYEAERKCLEDSSFSSGGGEAKDTRRYFQKKRVPRPQFTFKVDKTDQEPAQMASFIYLYPSIVLAEVYDPATNLESGQSLQEIKDTLKEKIKQLLGSDAISKWATGTGDWQKWYWAAPMLLDKYSSRADLYASWFSTVSADDIAIDSEEDGPQQNESFGKKKHRQFLEGAFRDPAQLDLPPLNETHLESLAIFLAALALGSPATCYLRTQLRSFGRSSLSEKLLNCAYQVASSFITLFNKPESIAIVRLTTSPGIYLDEVLEYSINGNIQSLLDEFVYLIIDLENLSDPKDICNYITDIVSVRTSSLEVDDFKSFKKKVSALEENPKRKMMRTHYAADFGGQSLTTAKSSGRQINIRQAFNSPFRPFVLATTSIGQEGLDFHLYCKNIFHWNLPANPIDFEQREGRIHRYKGLVIRQNLADKYRQEVKHRAVFEDPWQRLFSISEREKDSALTPCDLVPFWHIETTKGIKIERFVPLYPYSKDIEKYKHLLKVLAFYRLTFGQPRQEELIETLSNIKSSAELDRMRERLLINLSPIRWKLGENSY